MEAAVVGGAGLLQVHVRASHVDGGTVEGLSGVDFCVEVNRHPAWEYRASPMRLEQSPALCLAVPCDSGQTPEMPAKALAEAAGVAELVRGCWGYAVHDREHDEAKVGNILGLTADGLRQEHVAAGLEGWREMTERYARRPAGQEADRRVVVVVGRQRPPWLPEGLAQAAEVIRSAAVRMDIVQEAGAAGAEAVRAARSTGGAVVDARRGEAAITVRRLAESRCEGWRLEAEGVDPKSVHRLRAALRTGRYRGEAVLERA